ncbi:MAG TPA: phosphoribulokinase [Nevskiaceae bacterium]|nr:phosphoribulokinase [Nevskiaceae bacterium]
MSRAHPIVAVTGSSGAGTSTALKIFTRMFDELNIRAAIVEGDAFHAFDREGNRAAIERATIRGENFSLFGPAGNLFDKLQALFDEYAETGNGVTRRYLHTEVEAAAAHQAVGTFTPWERLPAGTDMLFYEGLHGGLITEEYDLASRVDLLVGVVPVINLEWIQKIRRDANERGYAPEDVTTTILRRMPDYVNYITPQFSRTDVNFQRVPLVDTSNPFVMRDIPAPEQTLCVAHFNDLTRVRADLDDFQRKLAGSFISDRRTLVVPGALMHEAMEVILKPAIARLASTRAPGAAAA